MLHGKKLVGVNGTPVCVEGYVQANVSIGGSV